jgi:hypothetical protein
MCRRLLGGDVTVIGGGRAATKPIGAEPALACRAQPSPQAAETSSLLHREVADRRQSSPFAAFCSGVLFVSGRLGHDDQALEAEFPPRFLRGLESDLCCRPD